MPGWFTLSLLALVIYFAYYQSRQRAQKEHGTMRLPTWFSKDNYEHIKENTGPLYQRNAERFLRIAAEMQSSSKKRNQVKIGGNHQEDIEASPIPPSQVELERPAVDETLDLWQKPEIENLALDEAPKKRQKLKQRYKRNPRQCPQCGLEFLTNHPQPCHLYDCYYDSK